MSFNCSTASSTEGFLPSLSIPPFTTDRCRALLRRLTSSRIGGPMPLVIPNRRNCPDAGGGLVSSTLLSNSAQRQMGAGRRVVTRAASIFSISAPFQALACCFAASRALLTLVQLEYISISDRK
jgi:hypothetical protein